MANDLSAASVNDEDLAVHFAVLSLAFSGFAQDEQTEAFLSHLGRGLLGMFAEKGRALAAARQPRL